MRILKKVLKLNYAEEKGDKQVVKSYTFDANTTVDETTLKDVGDNIEKLLSKTIDNITVTTKELI